ncbi:RNA polymerase sigma factor [Parapedobacter deserti]|uniref:RNA polymerase sigma factor n=1 Tax=Parapedobacter deserti TaxID=1912957 RepID=A0ABV7JIN0_9SPHI
MTAFDERENLEAIAGGNIKAFKTLFDSYHHRVYQYGLQLLKNEADAEELVQEVFAKIWLNRTALAEVKNFGAYLRTISRNHALTWLKRHALDRSMRNDEYAANSRLLFNDTENTVYYNETRKLLAEAVALLPPRQREVFIRCHVQGAKQAEAAASLGISIHTLKSHLQQATQSIKAYLLQRTDRFTLFLCLGIYVSQ